MNPFQRSLPMMLYRTLDAVMPEFRAIFAEFELTETQWRVLRVLWEQDGTPVGELGRVTAVLAPNLVGVLDRMQQADLVERRPSAEDRRQVRVFLRPRGRALEKSVRPRVDAVYARLQKVLKPAEWRALYSGLDKLSGYAAEATASRRSEAKSKAAASAGATKRRTTSVSRTRQSVAAKKPKKARA